MLPDNALGVAWAAGHTTALARTLSLSTGVLVAACRSVSLAGRKGGWGVGQQQRGLGLAAWSSRSVRFATITPPGFLSDSL